MTTVTAMERDRDKQKSDAKQRPASETPRLDRRDPPGGQVSHAERKGEGGRQAEEPHGDSEAV